MNDSKANSNQTLHFSDEANALVTSTASDPHQLSHLTECVSAIDKIPKRSSLKQVTLAEIELLGRKFLVVQSYSFKYKDKIIQKIVGKKERENLLISASNLLNNPKAKIKEVLDRVSLRASIDHNEFSGRDNRKLLNLRKNQEL